MLPARPLNQEKFLESFDICDQIPAIHCDGIISESEDNRQVIDHSMECGHQNVAKLQLIPATEEKRSTAPSNVELSLNSLPYTQNQA